MTGMLCTVLYNHYSNDTSAKFGCEAEVSRWPLDRPDIVRLIATVTTYLLLMRIGDGLDESSDKIDLRNRSYLRASLD